MSHRTLSWPVRATLVAMTAAAITGIGGAVATADDTTGPAASVTTYEVFRETVKPWDSIKIPSFGCPTGYLHNADYSPGRLVPLGVQVVENGGVGVSMSGATVADVQPKGLPLGVQVKDTTATPASATNWALAPRELVIILVCTTNPYNAAYYDPYHVWS